MYISRIKWPPDRKERERLYLNFLILAVENLGIVFPTEINNPMDIARQYLNGKVSEAEYEANAQRCWKFIDERHGLREFKDPDILAARLGISLLSANERLDEVGEKLAWFFEVLDYMRIDTEEIQRMMAEYFSFSQ